MGKYGQRLVRLTVVISMGAGGLAPVAGAVSADSHPGREGNAVTDWNQHAGEAAVAACISPALDPLHESRLYAMMHIAVHDALNAIDRRSRAYAFDADVRRRTSADAAVAAASRDVLVAGLGELPFPPSCVDAGVGSVEANYQAALDAIPDGRRKSRGVALGQAAAAAVLALRADDGSDTVLQDFGYPQGTEPGEYRFTPPFDFAFAPAWGEVTPFVLRDSAQFRAPAPYRLTSRRYAADVNEVQRLGGDDLTTPSTRTAEQTEIALFWVESSPLQWNRIARSAAVDVGLDLWQAARLFGLLNMAMADGYIGTFETKYHYSFWRPITAIRLAAGDGNPATTPDPTWTSLLPAPPIPDHDSGHSVQGGAAAQILKRVFGTDHVSFQVCSMTLPAGQTCLDPMPVLRSYDSFSQAADENGESRILVGFHFRKAVVDGIEHGRDIANRAVNRLLRPEH